MSGKLISDDASKVWCDADFERDRKRLLKLADKWIGPLGLRWWKIDMLYAKRPIRQQSADEERRELHTLAKTDVQWEYGTATIEWDMVEVSATDDEELEYAFVHECCHVLVNEMRACSPSDAPFDIRHEERVVTNLAKAFIWAANGDGIVGQDSPDSTTKSKRKTVGPKADYRARQIHGNAQRKTKGR